MAEKFDIKQDIKENLRRDRAALLDRIPESDAIIALLVHSEFDYGPWRSLSYREFHVAEPCAKHPEHYHISHTFKLGSQFDSYVDRLKELALKATGSDGGVSNPKKGPLDEYGMDCSILISKDIAENPNFIALTNSMATEINGRFGRQIQFKFPDNLN